VDWFDFIVKAKRGEESEEGEEVRWGRGGW